MTLTVRNASRLRAASLVAARPVRRPRRCRCRCCGCAPAGTPPCTTRCRPRRRGVVPVGPLRVTRRDPLGLVGAGPRATAATATVWVHPRIHLLARGARPALARSLDGRVDRVPHGTITFDSLREYVVGDELRRVHWRTQRAGRRADGARAARHQPAPPVVVLLDDRAAAHPTPGPRSTFEAACEAAASVVAAADPRGPAGRRCSWSPDRAGAPAGRPLDLLAEADPGAGGDLRAAVRPAAPAPRSATRWSSSPGRAARDRPRRWSARCAGRTRR